MQNDFGKESPKLLPKLYLTNFKRGSRNSPALSETINLTNLPQMTSLDAFGRPQNVTEYCIAVRKTGPVSKESNNSAPFDARSPLLTHNACRDFQVEVEWHFVRYHQLVGFLFSQNAISARGHDLCLLMSSSLVVYQPQSELLL